MIEHPPLLAKALANAGCPPDKCDEMAAQLDKRARQLAEQKGRRYEDALKHLLSLMAQGGAAKSKRGTANTEH
jgi:hypothetical protein